MPTSFPAFRLSLYISKRHIHLKKMMITRGFNVSLGSCGFSYVFSCLRLLSDVGIKKIHIGNRYVRKAWNLAFLSYSSHIQTLFIYSIDERVFNIVFLLYITNPMQIHAGKQVSRQLS